MQIVTINLPESYVKALEQLVAELGMFPSRSEAIRTAVKQFMNKAVDAKKKINRLNAIQMKRKKGLYW